MKPTLVEVLEVTLSVSVSRPERKICVMGITDWIRALEYRGVGGREGDID